MRSLSQAVADIGKFGPRNSFAVDGECIKRALDETRFQAIPYWGTAPALECGVAGDWWGQAAAGMAPANGYCVPIDSLRGATRPERAVHKFCEEEDCSWPKKSRRVLKIIP